MRALLLIAALSACGPVNKDQIASFAADSMQPWIAGLYGRDVYQLALVKTIVPRLVRR